MHYIRRRAPSRHISHVSLRKKEKKHKFLLFYQYRHQKFQFPLLDAFHCGTESDHSNGSLIGSFSLFILFPLHEYWNLKPNDNNTQIKETKIWLPFKNWCSLSVPRCAACHKGVMDLLAFAFRYPISHHVVFSREFSFILFIS